MSANVLREIYITREGINGEKIKLICGGNYRENTNRTDLVSCARGNDSDAIDSVNFPAHPSIVALEMNA